MCSILRKHLIYMACILLWSSAVKVHDLQAYSKMDVTREHISRLLELREILLEFQIGFNFVNAVCAVLESTSSSELSSVIIESRNLQLVTFSSFDFCIDATGVVCHQLGLLGTDLHAVCCGGFVEGLN